MDVILETATDASETETARDRPAAPKAVFVKTFGCQMNVYDSERMMEALARDGYAPTDAPDNADLVILNTCHIREKAAEKVYSDLGRLRQLKNKRLSLGKTTVIAVAGCIAQAEGREITARQPAVDLVIGPQSYHRLPALLARLDRGEKSIVETEFAADDKFKNLPSRAGRRAPAAFLTVQEGCDKFCTFCVVPYTRGAEFSRPVAEIEKEARKLVRSGVLELTLLGQNVNAYHGQGPDGQNWSLAALANHLSSIEGLKRIRYTTSHPRDMSDDLIAAHAENGKLMPFLHLPVQSGSDRILKAMNRRHTVEDYLRFVERIRAARPDIALSSDFIVGFPGETEREFEATLDLIRTVRFTQAYTFKYSSRPGTPAAKDEDQVSDEIKVERLVRLQTVLDAQQLAFNEAAVGQTLPVAFERKGRYPGQLVGRTPYLQAVHVEADEALIGVIEPVLVRSATRMSLAGVIQPA